MGGAKNLEGKEAALIFVGILRSDFLNKNNKLVSLLAVLIGRQLDKTRKAMISPSLIIFSSHNLMYVCVAPS